MSSLFAFAEQMVKTWQSLRATWDEARQSWKDVDRDRFEREYIEEFSQATNAYIASLQRLAETIQRIRNDTP